MKTAKPITILMPSRQQAESELAEARGMLSRLRDRDEWLSSETAKRIGSEAPSVYDRFKAEVQKLIQHCESIIQNEGNEHD